MYVLLCRSANETFMVAHVIAASSLKEAISKAGRMKVADKAELWLGAQLVATL
jgi:hypothetical protein